MKPAVLLILCSTFVLVGCQTYQAERLAEQGYEQLQQQDFSASTVSFFQASRKNKTNAKFRYNYLVSLYLEKKYEEVIPLSEEAFQTFPHYLAFLQLQAQAYADLKDYQKALDMYNRIFSLNPASYEMQAQVMQKALVWNEKEKAKQLALGLLGQNAYEKQALNVLSSVSEEPNWYQAALAYLTKAGEEEARK